MPEPPLVPDLKRVLIVDDEIAFAKIVSLQLQRSGQYQVKCLHEGAAVESVAEEWMPDVVLLDFLMPDMDGGQVFQRLKTNPALKHIPIIILTAVAKEDTPLEKGVRPGRLTLAKPVTFHKLNRAIQHLIGTETSVPA